jgi:S-DNA-T family DNA segregation ATPase FtsK/SpoIIIE
VTGRERLELRITYAPRFSAPRDVLVHAPPGATVEDLAAALAEHAGQSAGPDLYSDRAGALARDLEIAGGLVRDGDVLRTGAPRSGAVPQAASSLEAHIVGGPGAGRRIPLALGVATIGRSADATVSIDDPSLSRRHARLIVSAGGAAVADFDSRNGTAVDGERLEEGAERPLDPGDQVEIGRSLLSVRPAARTDEEVARRRGARIEFNRMPRMSTALQPESIEFSPPPERPAGARLPMAAALGPLALGVAGVAIMHEPAMLLFAALTPVMAVSTYISDRRGGRKTYASRLAAFRAQAVGIEKRLAAARAREIEMRRMLSPDPAALAVRATRHLPELWERRRQDADFLSLRLGTADQPAALGVSFPAGGEAHEREGVETRIRRVATLPAVPLSVGVLDAGGLGLSGDPAASAALARWLLVQAAVLHSPRELVICAALPAETGERDWHWLSWLPHAASSHAIFDSPNIALGAAAGDGLLRALAATADQRHEERERRFSARTRDRPAVLLLIDEAAEPSRALVDDLLSVATEVDMAVLWLGRDQRDLPGGCTAVVELARDRAAMDVFWPRDGRELRDATPDGLDLTIADEVARSLAPVRDVTQSRSAATIPRSASLLDVLGLPEPDAAAVLDRWSAASPGALRAPLGRSGAGRFAIDLRHDGPHGLVAGTTGAGKSELLQALVAGLAAEQPPSRVSFLFVDYKGGTAFKDCVRLPHTAGMVTDLDEHLTQRVMLSLNAELRRRERVLNEAGARDLLELERRAPEVAPPSLVIVVDEFAALKDEVPQFVDGLIDIAQRGRSLGVHLILATQRPGGVVSDRIRANTNLRIALRVQEPGESDDVIGDRAAARIPKSLPGRAYARTGHGELSEFQSAYGGAVTPAAGDARRIRVVDIPFAMTPTPESAAVAADGTTDLERLVAGIAAAADQLGLPRPRPPWLEQLPETLPLEALERAGEPHVVPLGKLDDPRRQRQATWSFDLERDGGVLVYGASGSGKTTLLRTVAVQLARAAEPRHLHVYALDCAGHGLASLEALPHCGGVLTAADEERVTRLLTTLLREIDERGRRFAAAGVSTLAEFRARSGRDEWPARLVLLLDSYSGFVSDLDRVDHGALVQMLARVLSEGRAAGVHVIATADRRNAVPPSVAALVSQRIVLRLASEDDYPTLGLDRKGVQGALLPPGRGFVDDTLELQVATIGSAAALAAEGERLAREHDGARAPAIPRMPSDVTRSALPPARDPARPMVGIEEAELGPAGADISDSAFLVCGPYRSGRTTALETLVLSMLDADPGTELHLLLPRRSALAELAPRAASTSRGADQCLETARRLQELVQSRSPDERHPLCAIVVDDVSELADGPHAAALELILRRGRDVNVRVLAACETGQARGFSAVLRELRKDGNGLLLEPSLDMDGELLGVRLPRRASLQFPPGRGFLVTGGLPVLVQVAH